MTPHIVMMTCPPRRPEPIIAAIMHYAIDLDRKGAFANAITALEMGLSLSGFDGGPVTIVQDDVITCQRFTEYLARLSPYIENQQQIVKWFHPGQDRWQPYAARPRLVEVDPDTDSFVGTQAVTYSSYWARKILAFLKAVPFVRRVGPHCDDAWISEALKSYRKTFFIHRPSLVQHIGTDSLVSPGMKLIQYNRFAPDFVGIDFDVMTWPVPQFNLLP
jgi:hypothetical protein